MRRWNAVLAAFGALYIVGAVFWLLMKVERPIEE